MAQSVKNPSRKKKKKKNLPAMQETGVPSLWWKIPWRRKLQHCSILAWEIPKTEEPAGLQSMGSHKSQTQLSNCIMFKHDL